MVSSSNGEVLNGSPSSTRGQTRNGGGMGADGMDLNGTNKPSKTLPRDFTWSETDEPHASRRKLILAKHPEIAELFGYEMLTFPIVVGIFLVQVAGAYYSQQLSFPVWLLCCWGISGTLNHTLQLATHEITHNLCFPNALANRFLGIFANLSTGVPSATTFQKYHMEHHRFQGVDGVDSDIPTTWEVRFFRNAPLKVLWLLLQPLAYSLRPMFCKPKAVGPWEVFSFAVQMSFNFSILYFMSVSSFLYLLVGTLLGMGLHPAAGHFVAEHYELVAGYETYSYYGPLNWVNFNVGYHNEHHDFPKIPWSRLSKVRKLAPEFYDNLPCHTSYLAVFWRYITDNEIGPHSRVKRQLRSKKAE
jgi:sphingolipid delta-4 desaturase